MVDALRPAAAALVLLAFAAALALPASAADAVYPPGSRIGLVPPPGLAPASNFFGFEDREKKVAVLFIVLPPNAFAEIEKTTTPEAIKQQGVTAEKREEFAIANGKAVLLTGSQTIEGVPMRKWLLLAGLADLTAIVTVQVPQASRDSYTDDVVRTALASLAVRPSVPVDEQLSLLPFKVGELSGFRIGGLSPGRAVMLTDEPVGPIDPNNKQFFPHFIVGVLPGGPGIGADRDVFARNVFATVPGLTDLRLTGSEALRIAGQTGHQIMATGKDARTGAEVNVVQWLRFGGGGFLHMVGVAPKDAWLKAYMRFRAIRDGIEPR
jgi:hypothetical protein